MAWKWFCLNSDDGWRMNVLIFIVKADLNSEQQPISLVIPDDTNNLDKTKIQTVNNSQLVYIYPWHK